MFVCEPLSHYYYYHLKVLIVIIWEIPFWQTSYLGGISRDYRLFLSNPERTSRQSQTSQTHIKTVRHIACLLAVEVVWLYCIPYRHPSVFNDSLPNLSQNFLKLLFYFPYYRLLRIFVFK